MGGSKDESKRQRCDADAAGGNAPQLPNGRPNQPLQMTQNPTTGNVEYTKQRVSNGLLHPTRQI